MGFRNSLLNSEIGSDGEACIYTYITEDIRSDHIGIETSVKEPRREGKAGATCFRRLYHYPVIPWCENSSCYLTIALALSMLITQLASTHYDLIFLSAIIGSSCTDIEQGKYDFVKKTH